MEWDANKYRFKREIRPFSYSVAIATCGLGVILATHEPGFSLVRAIMVMLVGILFQVAVNLMNNYSERHQWQNSTHADKDHAIRRIRRNNRVGLGAGILGFCLGLILCYLVGWPLLILGGIGMLAGYYYTGEPVAYKNRGLGVVGVFLFMGILMVFGAAWGASGTIDWIWLLDGMPVGLVSAALLLSNELRDIAEDRAEGVRTLTVRIGERASRVVFLILIIGAFVVLSLLAVSQRLSWHPATLFVAAVAGYLLIQTAFKKHDYHQMTPNVGRFFMIFGIVNCYLAF